MESLGRRRSQRLRRESDELRADSLVLRHSARAAVGNATQLAKRAENERRFAARGPSWPLRDLAGADEELRMLEELARTSDELQAANRELERLNEALRSANERLWAGVTEAEELGPPRRPSSQSSS